MFRKSVLPPVLSWVGGDEHRHRVDEGHARLQRRLGVMAHRPLGAHRQVAHQHVGPGLLQLLGHVHRLGVGHAEGHVLVVIGHVRGHAVQHRAHLHGHAGFRNLGLEHHGVVGLGENGLFQRLAHLAPVHIKGSHPLNIPGFVPGHVRVHQAGGTIIAIATVIFDPLNERTCAIANARDGYTDLLVVHFFLPCRS